MSKILITTSSFGKYSKIPLSRLKEAGFDIIMNPHGRVLDEEEALALYTDDICGVIAGTEKISAKLIQEAKNLKVISRCGTGIDNIDLDTTKKMGIRIYNTPDGPTVAVAELTVALILNLLRKVNTMNKELKEGQWNKKMGNLLSSKKVGIMGFGKIGQKVAELLSSFGVELAYYDVIHKSSLAKICFKEKEDLLSWADIITLHLSKSKDNKPVLGHKELNLMRSDAWFINTSRGGIVDEKALEDYLRDKKIAGAALDVFEDEPYKGALSELDNVIITPHIGSYAKEARVNMEIEVVENLIKGLKECRII